MKQFLVFIAILLYCNLYAQDFNVEEYIQKGIDAFGNAQYEEAINYLRPCEEFYSQFSDSVSKSNDAELLSMEATVYGSLGDYKKAIDCETKSSIILKSLYGVNHPDYATSLSNLANEYSNLGDYNKAIEIGTQAMDIRKQMFGEKHPDYAASLSDLANYYSNQGDYSKAVEFGTQAMNIRKQALG